MSGFIVGQSRTQVTLFPEVLDDFIPDNNPVRVVDTFVNELNLAEMGFKRTTPKLTGRPGYDPAIMLKLYIYGYLNRIQSSRRLERESQRNVELMWLVERLTPDFKTIADFRKDNTKGIKNTCKTFVEICRKLNMFKDTIITIDGSKFKAVNNKRNNFTPSKVKGHIERVERHIQVYLNQLNEADDEDKAEVNPTNDEQLLAIKETLANLKALEEKVSKAPDKQISTTDPDSRLMKVKGFIRQVCYNVQTAVDTKHHLIAAHEVTNRPSDRSQLCSMGKKAQTALHKKDITVIADKGYFAGQDIKDAQDAGMIPIVPKGDTSGSAKKGIFNRLLFKYDPEKDIYICPANEVLTYRFTAVEKGVTLKRYFLDIMTCRACSKKSRCTTGKGQRKITRWEDEDRLEQMAEILTSQPDSMIIRKQTVEHPFGTIKYWMGSTHFQTKRFKNVSTEMNLHVLAYNLNRMVSILGSQNLMKAMMA